MSHVETHWETLGVSEQATTADIIRAYKKQALLWHPDRLTAENKSEGTRKFQKLAEAYHILKDETFRVQYANSLRQSQAIVDIPQPPKKAGYSRPASRSSSHSPPQSTATSTPAPHQRTASGPGYPRATQNRTAFPSIPQRRDSAVRIDPFKVFTDAWGGRKLDDIEDEISRRAAAPSYSSDGRKSQSWDDSLYGRGSDMRFDGARDVHDARDQRGRERERERLQRRESGGGMGTWEEGYRPMSERRQSSRGRGLDKIDINALASGAPIDLRLRAEFGRRRAQSVSGYREPKTVKEVHQTIITVEKEANGSVRMSREMKSRTLTDDGMLHDRYRRQRAGVEYDDDPEPSYRPERGVPKMTIPSPRKGYASRREASEAEAPYSRPSYSRPPSYTESPHSAYPSSAPSTLPYTRSPTRLGTATPMRSLSIRGSPPQVTTMRSPPLRPRTQSFSGGRPGSYVF